MFCRLFRSQRRIYGTHSAPKENLQIALKFAVLSNKDGNKEKKKRKKRKLKKTQFQEKNRKTVDEFKKLFKHQFGLLRKQPRFMGREEERPYKRGC